MAREGELNSIRAAARLIAAPSPDWKQHLFCRSLVWLIGVCSLGGIARFHVVARAHRSAAAGTAGATGACGAGLDTELVRSLRVEASGRGQITRVLKRLERLFGL